MKRIREWWRQWRSFRKVVKAYRLTAHMEAEFKASEKRLKRLKKRHEAAERLHRAVSESVVGEMDRMEESNERWDKAMSLLRQDNEILHDLVVVNLEAHWRVALERLQAMAALEVGRRVGLQGERE